MGRNDLSKDLAVLLGTLGTLAAGGIAAANSHSSKKKRKEEINANINRINNRINQIEYEIQQEQNKGWLFRNNNIINDLKSERAQLLSARTELLNEMNE